MGGDFIDFFLFSNQIFTPFQPMNLTPSSNQQTPFFQTPVADVLHRIPCDSSDGQSGSQVLDVLFHELEQTAYVLSMKKTDASYSKYPAHHNHLEFIPLLFHESILYKDPFAKYAAVFKKITLHSVFCQFLAQTGIFQSQGFG